MLWKQELENIEDLLKKVTNLGSNVSRELTQLESRRDTLANELTKLDADYAVIQSRNEEAKKEFQKSRRLDIEQFEENKRRVQQREIALIEKEKELRKLKAEMETEMASVKLTKQQMENLGRNHVKK